jgi:hypothetical protein
MSKLHPNTIHWGKELVSISLLSDESAKESATSNPSNINNSTTSTTTAAMDVVATNQVKVCFSDGVSVNCSLVVGADGIRSKTRYSLSCFCIHRVRFVVLWSNSYEKLTAHFCHKRKIVLYPLISIYIYIYVHIYCICFE